MSGRSRLRPKKIITESSVLPNKKKMSKTVVSACIAVVVLVIAFFVAIHINNSLKKDTDTIVQISEATILIKDAQTALTKNDAVALEDTIAKIKTSSGYESDPNRLYILVVSAIKAGKATEARLYMDKLLLAYKGDKGFSAALEKPRSIIALEEDVRSLESQAKQFQQNNAKGLVSQ